MALERFAGGVCCRACLLGAGAGLQAAGAVAACVDLVVRDLWRVPFAVAALSMALSAVVSVAALALDGALAGALRLAAPAATLASALAPLFDARFGVSVVALAWAETARPFGGAVVPAVVVEDGVFGMRGTPSLAAARMATAERRGACDELRQASRALMRGRGPKGRYRQQSVTGSVGTTSPTGCESWSTAHRFAALSGWNMKLTAFVMSSTFSQSVGTGTGVEPSPQARVAYMLSLPACASVGMQPHGLHRRPSSKPRRMRSLLLNGPSGHCRSPSVQMQILFVPGVRQNCP